MPKVLNLPFLPDLGRPERDNAIDGYIIGDEPEDVLRRRRLAAVSSPEQPDPLTREEKRAYLDGITGVSLGSDAFFPFGDNIERATPQRRELRGPARRLHPGRSGH